MVKSPPLSHWLLYNFNVALYQHQSFRCRGRRRHALNPVPQQQHFVNSFHHGDTSLLPGSTPYLMVARRFTHFSSFSTPEVKRHTKKVNHSTSSENPPMYPLKQSEHTRHAFFL